MKQCNRCLIEKTPEDFPPRGSNGLWPYCRPCKQEYDREYWHKTKHKRNKRKQANSKEIKKRNRQYIWKYLETHPCVDCGESDKLVLQFDHIRDKKKPVSCMSMYAIETIQAEIDKCEVRCANCHQRKTSKQMGWYL